MRILIMSKHRLEKPELNANKQIESFLYICYYVPTMDEIYTKIGNFIIKVGFYNKFDEARTVYLRNKSEMDLFTYLRLFIILNKPKKYDFEIEMTDGGDPNLINMSNKVYSPLFQITGEKKIITYYQNTAPQFEVVLKHALFSLLKENGGFGIHASAARIGNKAYLFLGESGDGKSTIAELIKDKFPTLNDDITLIKKIDNKYYVFQTPFIEKPWWIKKTQKLYPVDKIFFIHKSNEFKIKPKLKNQSLKAALLKQVFAAQYSDGHISKNLNNFISNMNNFYDLYFAKDKSETIKLISQI